MTGSGVRRVLAICGASLLAVALASCSGGSAPVSVGPPTTNASHTTSTTNAGSAKKVAAARSAKKHAAKISAQSKAKPAASKATGSTHGATGGSSQSQLAITVSTTAPSRSTSTWEIVGTTTPHTAPRVTPTTRPGPKPFDPTKPIDLGGTPGVTPAEQARAEQLVRDALRDLPRYANPATAYADGFRSIGDGFTGSEHYIKWSYVDDDHILDSKFPESLVYQIRNGVKTLVSAMYMLKFGARFTDAPDVGGALTQWHIHNNLCLVDNPRDPLQKVVGSLTGADGSCPAGSSKAATSPMLHVWIVANPCGPFAALEGVSAGQVDEGQTQLCDTAHGSH